MEGERTGEMEFPCVDSCGSLMTVRHAIFSVLYMFEKFHNIKLKKKGAGDHVHRSHKERFSVTNRNNKSLFCTLIS